MTLHWWEWLILILVLVIVGGLLWAYFGARDIEVHLSQNPNLPQATLKEFYDKADNGDLILLAGDTRGERSCKWATGSVFSHVGMLFRESHPDTKEDVLYIWEADIGQGSRKGPRVMFLKDKLQRYKGLKVFGWRQLIGPRPLTERILELVPRYSKMTLDSQMWPWILSSSLPLSRWSKNSKKVFCSELLTMTLQDLKMLDPKETPHRYSPQDFHQTEVLGLLPQWNYSKTTFVRFGAPKEPKGTLS